MHRVNDVSYALRADRRRHACVLAGLIVCAARLRHRRGARRCVVTTMVFAAGLSYRYLAGVALLLLPGRDAAS